MTRIVYIDGESYPDREKQVWTEVEKTSPITRVGGYPTQLDYFIKNWPHVKHEDGKIIPLVFKGQMLYKEKLISIFSSLFEYGLEDIYSETFGDSAAIIAAEYTPNWIINKDMTSADSVKIESETAVAPSVIPPLPSISADWLERFEELHEQQYKLLFQIPDLDYYNGINNGVETFLFEKPDGTPVSFSETW